MAPLRLVTTNQSSHQSIRSPTHSVSTSEYTTEQDTVQVQDTDFELIKPTLPLSPFGGSFESLPSPVRPGFLRTDSPALSDISGHSYPHPASVSSSDIRSPKDEASQIEAHRQRELRWISAMSSISSSQARKSKKIRKMVLDGVPASVRYQVWATLTDSKGKRMEGLYQRLAQREKVAAYPEIERDIQSSFIAHPQLQDGSLAKLLQAYLSMVPDIQYSRGLALVAAQLLLQSPEEDAFWTFISLMDSHLRPYFSSSNVQLEVDASLFAKALESNDAASAKKIFGDMAISPVIVCRAWFTTVFADALPSDYLVRLWDVFLFEGVTFLFRAGLALFSCTRRLFLQSTSPEAVLDILSRPPSTSLPPSPNAFIELAFSMKFKDDDVRKQRGKLEAQVKRRTAQARASPISPAITPTISLPKSGV
ncbi:RabGAP/TBC [Dichomitus squalens]|uniref:RabGAP/TBC n=1 Tax=Dichomitus squalens TaxID=114155 RepID=A0A4Q9M5D0_9APHY|nr:RabGAP/TBC [Dichomitus squalens]